MATIRKLRGRWQASVRRKGLKPQAKSFDKKCDAERWARELESEIDQRGFIPDTKPAETMTLADLMQRYLLEITPRKRGAAVESDYQPSAHAILAAVYIPDDTMRPVGHRRNSASTITSAKPLAASLGDVSTEGAARA